MSRISSIFSDRKHKALVLYFMLGFPSDEVLLDTIPRLVTKGCDIIELGIPFSDPLADGATIQEAGHHALKHKFSVRKCFNTVAALRQRTEAPIVLMGYYNPVFNMGQERFCLKSAQAGADGLIVPDLPLEEAASLEAISARNNLDLIYLVAPTSTSERIAAIAGRTRGFLYLVSLTGTTGARKDLPADLEYFVSRVRKLTGKPLCVGFGISSPEQAARVAGVADGVIIGSRIIQFMAENKMDELESFVKKVRQELDSISSSKEANM